MENEDTTLHPPSGTEDTEYYDDPPAHPEDRTYVDADAEVTEPEENFIDPYRILRDDQFALIPQ